MIIIMIYHRNYLLYYYCFGVSCYLLLLVVYIRVVLVVAVEVVMIVLVAVVLIVYGSQ